MIPSLLKQTAVRDFVHSDGQVLIESTRAYSGLVVFLFVTHTVLIVYYTGLDLTGLDYTGLD